MQCHTKNDMVLVQVRNIIICDDAEDYRGAEIEDFDRDNFTAWLYIDPDEIDLEVNETQEVYVDEAWGQSAVIRETYLEVERCSWNGHDIINAEEVANEIYTH